MRRKIRKGDRHLIAVGIKGDNRDLVIPTGQIACQVRIDIKNLERQVLDSLVKGDRKLHLFLHILSAQAGLTAERRDEPLDPFNIQRGGNVKIRRLARR